jgi:Na+-driven multidrug efflux pump
MIPRKHDKILGTERTGKLLVRMSVSVTVTMQVNFLYNLVDTVFIARGVGTDAIGGLTVSPFPFRFRSWRSP